MLSKWTLREWLPREQPSSQNPQQGVSTWGRESRKPREEGLTGKLLCDCVKAEFRWHSKNRAIQHEGDMASHVGLRMLYSTGRINAFYSIISECSGSSLINMQNSPECYKPLLSVSECFQAGGHFGESRSF